jgi:hypothetical protein
VGEEGRRNGRPQTLFYFSRTYVIDCDDSAKLYQNSDVWPILHPRMSFSWVESIVGRASGRACWLNDHRLYTNCRFGSMSVRKAGWPLAVCWTLASGDGMHYCLYQIQTVIVFGSHVNGATVYLL